MKHSALQLRSPLVTINMKVIILTQLYQFLDGIATDDTNVPSFVFTIDFLCVCLMPLSAIFQLYHGEQF